MLHMYEELDYSLPMSPLGMFSQERQILSLPKEILEFTPQLKCSPPNLNTYSAPFLGYNKHVEYYY
jgi:hypothetical protein